MSLSGMVEISRTFVEAKFVFPLPFGERVRVRGAALTPLRFRFRPHPLPSPAYAGEGGSVGLKPAKSKAIGLKPVVV